MNSEIFKPLFLKLFYRNQRAERTEGNQGNERPERWRFFFSFYKFGFIISFQPIYTVIHFLSFFWKLSKVTIHLSISRNFSFSSSMVVMITENMIPLTVNLQRTWKKKTFFILKFQERRASKDPKERKVRQIKWIQFELVQKSFNVTMKMESFNRVRANN